MPQFKILYRFNPLPVTIATFLNQSGGYYLAMASQKSLSKLR